MNFQIASSPMKGEQIGLQQQHLMSRNGYFLVQEHSCWQTPMEKARIWRGIRQEMDVHLDSRPLQRTMGWRQLVPDPEKRKKW